LSKLGKFLPADAQVGPRRPVDRGQLLPTFSRRGRGHQKIIPPARFGKVEMKERERK